MTDQKITDSPDRIAKIIRNAKGRPAFFVHGETPLQIAESPDRYYPLAGNVSVTKPAMLRYLADLSETAKRRKESHNETLVIELTILGRCYFV